MKNKSRFAAPIRYESRGLRLHPALWEQIDNEARSVKLKTTDFLRRKIEDAFLFDPDVQESHTDVAVPHTGRKLVIG